MNQVRGMILAATTFFLPISSSVQAQCREARLGGVPGQSFNYPAIDNESLFVGSLGTNGGAGAAFGFARDSSGWHLAQIVTSSNSAGLGTSCSVSGDVLLLGAPNEPTGPFSAGAAYFFQRVGTTWIEIQRVSVPPTPSYPMAFGRTVDVDGDSAVVGAPFDGFGGAAYVFERGPWGWARTARLVAADGASLDRLGYRVAIDGDRILLSTINDNPTGAGSIGGGTGAAYVFERVGSSWPEVAKLSASDAAFEDYAGSGIDIVGDRAYVGAHGSSSTVHIAGAVYVYEDGPTGWSEVFRLEQPVPTSSDAFGTSLAATQERLLVGTPARLGNVPGKAFLYSTSDWMLEATIESTQFVDGFGFIVALSEQHAVVGAPFDEFVFIYNLVVSDRFCEAFPNSTGSPALLHALGCSVTSANAFELVASPVPMGQPGLFFFGPAETSIPFGDGLRCVGGGPGQIHRLPPVVADPAEDLSLDVDFGVVSNLAPGSTWKFQAWYRDPDAQGAGFNLSDGLSISFQ